MFAALAPEVITEYAPEYYDNRDNVRGRITVRRGIPYKPPLSAGGAIGPVQGTTPPMVVDYYTPRQLTPAQPAQPQIILQQPAVTGTAGIQLSTTHLVIGGLILLFLLKGK